MVNRRASLPRWLGLGVVSALAGCAALLGADDDCFPLDGLVVHFGASGATASTPVRFDDFSVRP